MILFARQICVQNMCVYKYIYNIYTLIHTYLHAIFLSMSAEIRNGSLWQKYDRKLTCIKNIKELVHACMHKRLQICKQNTYSRHIQKLRLPAVFFMLMLRFFYVRDKISPYLPKIRSYFSRHKKHKPYTCTNANVTKCVCALVCVLFMFLFMFFTRVPK